MITPVHNERSTVVIKIRFADPAGKSMIPTSVVWRVFDAESNTDMMDGDQESAPESLAHAMELVVPSEANRIVTPTNVKEKRRVTVEWDYGLNSHGTADYVYQVKNLSNVD